MRRRDFNRMATLASAGLALHPLSILASCSTEKKTKLAKIGLQLWTVRESIEKNLEKTLSKVAEVGFAGVETAFWPEHISLEQGAIALRKFDLPVFSIHSELPFGKEQENILKMTEAYKCNRIVWHGWPEDPRYKTEAGTLELGDIYNEANEFSKKEGLVFGVHNHWWEFEKHEFGWFPFEILFDKLDEDIFFEIDTYWVKVAGQDPAEIVDKFGKRAPLLHIKDGTATWTDSLDEDQPDPMVAVGRGVQDFPAIVSAAKGNTEWMIVELDNCATDMMTAVQESYTYLVDNGLGIGK